MRQQKRLIETFDEQDRDVGSTLPTGGMSLERVVHHLHAAGVTFARAKARFERLELFKNTVKAAVMQAAVNASPEAKLSETRLSHMAEASKEYANHLEKLAEARAEYEMARVRYESLKNLFEAKRSQLSYEKAEMGIL